jgi:outer membrane protein
MKHLIRSLTAIGLFSAATLISQAQPAPKIATVDMEKLFNNDYRTIEQQAKLKEDEQSAQNQIDQIQKDINTLAAQFKEAQDQSNNPALSADAKAKATADAQAKYKEINDKNQEGQNLVNTVKNAFAARIQSFRTSTMDQISQVVVTVAKRHGANFVIDKSGQNSLGVSPFLYTDPAYDITDEVMAEISKNRPPSSAAPAPAADAAPKITVPGIGAPSK